MNNNFEEPIYKFDSLEGINTNKGLMALSDLHPALIKHLEHLDVFQRNIIIKLRRNELNKPLIQILYDFFKLKDETAISPQPAPEMLQYHQTLTYEIYTMLHKKPKENIFSELFIIFLKLDFNKHSVVSFYTELIERLRAQNNQSEKSFFEIADFFQTNIKIHQSYSSEDQSLLEAVLNACATPLAIK